MIVQIAFLVGLGTVLGALVGRAPTCPEGACPLTSTPRRGALWGGLIGLLLALSIGGGMQTTSALAEPPDTALLKGAYVELSTPAEFQEKVLQREGASLVYFHASWCGACRQYSPVFDRVAVENGAKAGFVKIDADQAQQLARKYKIQYLPTTLLMKGDQEIQRFVGVASERDLLKAIETVNHPAQETSNDR
ncbi:MAG: thioredoxin fold domain-containing protein [Nitrospiraceae bacterium]|nr:thioredoxin fold domain-containing protein [Nitrospiraceae bacterium]